MKTFKEIVEKNKQNLLYGLDNFEKNHNSNMSNEIVNNEIAQYNMEIENIEDYTLSRIARICSYVADILCHYNDKLLAISELKQFGFDENDELIKEIKTSYYNDTPKDVEKIRKKIWDSIPGIDQNLITMEEYAKILYDYKKIKDSEVISNEEKAEALRLVILTSLKSGLPNHEGKIEKYSTPEEIREQTYRIYNINSQIK